MPTAYDAIVLAGGAARRLGGADKPGVRVGGRALLDRVLAACAGARTTVVVGGRRPTARPVLWAREDPPGGGPLAALDAGLRHITRRDGRSCSPPTCRSSSARDRTAAARHPGAARARKASLLTDADGRDQPLVAAYRAEPLRRELALLAAEHGSLTGLPLRLLTRSSTSPGSPDPVAVLRLRHLGGHRHSPGPYQGAWERAG